MNRTYRRIWSNARRCWVVASELSSPRGKPLSTAAASIAACVLFASGGSVFNASGAIFNESCDPLIADYYQCTPSWGHDDSRIFTVIGRNARNSLVTGNGTEIDGGYSTLFGHRSRTLGDRNAVFGYNALASEGYSTAVGAYSRAEGVGAIAVGNDARAHSQNSIAVGSGARTNESSAGVSRIAIGGNAYAGSAGYSGAIALGGNARAEYDALAIGHDAKATAVGAVALGRNSQATESNSVSVGSASIKRRIVNVGDARLSTTSTDAVTGKQLHATNVNVTTATTTANAARTTANTAKTTADAALAKANVSNELIRQSSGASSVLLGSQNTGRTLDVHNKSGETRYIYGVRNGTLSADSTDAVTGQQLYATNQGVTAARTAADSALAKANVVSGLVGQAAPAGSVRLGAENTGTVLDVRNKGNASRKISGVADATLSSTSTDAVSGRQLTATNSNVTVAQNAATAAQTTATGARTVADSALGKAAALEGLVGQTSASGNVRLGAQNTGTVLDVANKAGVKRRIYNIANGVLSAGSTDAVTGQQLFATNALVEGNATKLKGHAQQLLAQDGRISDNRSDLHKLREEVDNFDPDLDGVVKFSDDRSFVDMEGATLKGISAGDIGSAGSTDAVNGGQLYATNVRVESLEMAGRLFAVGGETNSGAASAGDYSVAIGNSANATPASEGGTALGSFANALGRNSVALGRAAYVEDGAENGFALGAGSFVFESYGVAIGASALVEASAANAVAVGSYSVASESDTASFGNSTTKRRLVNVGRGVGADDAATVAQLSELTGKLGGGAGIDAGGNVVGPEYLIQGSNYDNVGEALGALDRAVVRSDARVDTVEHQLRSVFQNTPSTRSDGLPQLNLAGTNGMVLGNVANGVVAAGSRDAVNGGQLHSMQQQLNGRMDGLESRIDGQPQSRAMSVASADTGTPAADDAPPSTGGNPPLADAGNAPKSAPQPKAEAPAPEAPTPQVDTAELEKMLARANEYSDGVSREVDRRLDRMDKRFNRMAAMSSAQSAMAMNTAGLNTYNRLGAGVGYAEGESAMAVGYQRVLNDKGSATFSLNGAFTNSGERSMGVGVGIGW